MSGRVELRLPPDTHLVGLARLVVVTAARQAGLDDERLEDLRLVVSEATTNAMLAHTRSGRDDLPVELCVEGLLDAPEFTVSVRDRGPGFDPADPVGAPQRDWTDENGLGLTLMRGLADGCDFVNDEGMLVRLRFSLSGERVSA